MLDSWWVKKRAKDLVEGKQILIDKKQPLRSRVDWKADWDVLSLHVSSVSLDDSEREKCSAVELCISNRLSMHRDAVH